MQQKEKIISWCGLKSIVTSGEYCSNGLKKHSSEWHLQGNKELHECLHTIKDLHWNNSHVAALLYLVETCQLLLILVIMWHLETGQSSSGDNGSTVYKHNFWNDVTQNDNLLPHSFDKMFHFHSSV
jgi:hypothetical protein